MNSRARAIFENRYDAGRKLAAKLIDYKGKPVVVLAIPNGGAPIAIGVAVALQAEFNLVISRKIPLPMHPDAGFGALTDDGAVILNEELVKSQKLTDEVILNIVSQVSDSIKQRSLVYRKLYPHANVAGKTVIIVDDGLASGYTMLAAIRSIRARHPRQVIAAVPVANEVALQKVDRAASKVVTCAVGSGNNFFISDHYRYWNEPTDNEVLTCLKDCENRVNALRGQTLFSPEEEPTSTRLPYRRRHLEPGR